MAAKALPSSDLLNQLLRYDPKTGKLFWKNRPESHFKRERDAGSWNTRYAGSEAFAGVDFCGYRVGAIDQSTYKAHRIIWAMVNGCEPSSQIDHINGDPSDNRIENLRLVDCMANARNQRIRANNTSGIMGVYWKRPLKMWAAQIGSRRNRQHLGYFVKKSDAVAARKKAEVELGFHENHGKAKMPRSAAVSIDRRAIPMTRARQAADTYDTGGNLIPGASTTVSIKAVIQPAMGNKLMDVPEGIRTEAGWFVWSRSELAVDDRITNKGVTYRVLFAWPRDEGGFYRAALGKVAA